MGENFIYPGLITILSIGVFPMLIQEPIWGILQGMNVHGRVGLIQLGAAIVAVSLLTLGLMLMEWGLIGAALCFTLPRFVVDGIVTPVYACRRLEVPVWSFYWPVYLKPMLCAAPFAFGLVAIKLNPNQSLGYDSLIAIPVSAASALLYWFFLIPSDWQRKFLRFVRVFVRAKHLPSSCN